MISLTSQFGVPEAVRYLRPTKLVSLLDPGWMFPTPAVIRPCNHLKLAVSDLTNGHAAPNEEHITRLLEFGSEWAPGESLLVHCAGGRSRSPAAIVILLTQKNPGREFEVAKMVRDGAHQICPNVRIVEIGDRLLECGGRLIEAVKAMPEPTLRDCQGRHVSFPTILRK